MKCPICEKGTLRRVLEKSVMFGVDLGTYTAQGCTACRETFFDENAAKQIEQAAKRKGVWGLGTKTKISRSGNSLAIRIPKELVRYMKIREGRGVYVHPEKDRLIVELEE